MVVYEGEENSINVDGTVQKSNPQLKKEEKKRACTGVNIDLI